MPCPDAPGAVMNIRVGLTGSTIDTAPPLEVAAVPEYVPNTKSAFHRKEAPHANNNTSHHVQLW